MSLDFQNENGFAVSTRDRLTIAPPRIEPDAGPDGCDDEYQFGVRLSGERYGVSLLVAAGADIIPSDGVEHYRLDDVAAVRHILTIRERSGSAESMFAYLCSFASGLLLAIAGSDDRGMVTRYAVSAPRTTLVAAGVPADEIPSMGEGERIELSHRQALTAIEFR